MNNAFFQFLAELISRLFSNKPGFFKVIQWIAFLAGGFSASVQYLKDAGTALPSWVAVVGNVNVVVGAVVALIIAQLPTKQGE